MKKRILSLALALVLSLGCLMIPASARPSSSPLLDGFRKTQLTKATPFDEAYVYPYATSLSPAGVSGDTLVLQFRRNKMSPAPDDIFLVEIYECSISALFDSNSDPYQVISRQYKMSQFTGSPASLDMTVRLDYRFKPGVDYCYICGVLDKNEEMYGQMFFYSNLYVTDSPVYTQSVSPSVAEDEQFETDTVQTNPGKTAIVLPVPNPLNATVKRSVSAVCANPKIATVRVDAGYIYLTGVAYGKTEITVQYGSIKSTWPVYVYGIESLDVLPEKTTLCVGQTDQPKVTARPNYPVCFEWTSDHPEIATVKDGVITAVSPGKATITGETVGRIVTLEYTVRSHELPADTPVTGPTATQPRQAVGHCSVCGKDDAANVFEPAIFTDTVWNSWYAQHVDKVYDAGLMKGTGEHTFAPNANVTRAMAATVLYRIAGEPAVMGEIPFSDVPEGKYYTNAVIWAAQNGVVAGFPDGTFRPNDNITREQLAAILYRYASAGDSAVENDIRLDSFPDAANVHNYARAAMTWAVGAGLINGVGSGGKSYLQPANNATRAQFATIISRYLTTVEPVVPEKPDPGDSDSDHPTPTPTDPDMPTPVDPDP